MVYIVNSFRILNGVSILEQYPFYNSYLYVEFLVGVATHTWDALISMSGNRLSSGL